MGVTTRLAFSNFIEELNGKLTRIYDEQAKRRVSGDVGMKVFTVEDDSNYASSYQMVGTMGGTQKVAEGQDFPETTTVPGYKKIVTQNHYANSFRITKDHRVFIANKWKEIKKLPSNMTRDAFNKIDQSFADVLNNGWSTSYTDVFGTLVDATGPDGVSLFSDSHKVTASGNTMGNIIWDGGATSVGTVNPALSRAALVAAKAMARKAKDSSGILSEINVDTLLVSADDEDLAYRITRSKYIQGSPNNDVNPDETVGGFSVLVWARLTKGYWFVYEKAMVGETLYSGFAQKPQMEAPFQYPKNQDRLYTMDFYYYIQIGDAAYIYGSKGTNAA